MGHLVPGLLRRADAPSTRIPALKAVSPQAPVTDWFMGDDFHHNGAFFLADAFDFYASFGKPRPKPTKKSVVGLRPRRADGYDFFLAHGAALEREHEVPRERASRSGTR